MFRFKNNKGFTIIELLVVMAVIGILVLLAMPKFMGYTEKARLTEIKSNIKTLETASERYYIDNQDWPRLRDTPYTAMDITSFAEEIKNRTGQVITLDPAGNYYELDYNKLQKYVQKPKDGVHYILQNPVGEVFYLDKLTPKGKSVIEQETPLNYKPTAVITMTPNQAIMTNTPITWDYLSSTDPDGDSIVDSEWQGKQNMYTTEGEYTVQLRVKDNKDNWSDWVSITFYVMNYQGVKQISTGGNHTVVLFNDGTVKAWGYNYHGELGDGTKSSSGVLTPVTVTGLTNVKQISAGWYHTVALLNDGTVKAWGDNAYGQIGDNSTTERLSPTTVTGLTDVKQVYAGSYHTVALLNDGTVKTWGQNNYGQLGDNTKINRYIPTTVPNLTNIIQVSVGDAHTVALLDDGTVKVWGWNQYGQLGDNTTTDKLVPTIISGLTNIRQISAGSIYTVALLNDGTAKAWGYNGQGQLGDNTTVDKLTPTTILNLTNIIQLSAGGNHTVALLNDGTVKTWGRNHYGQLGDNTFTDKSTPTTVPGLTNVRQISAGQHFVFVVLNDGIVKAWGYNGWGQFGDGTKNNSKIPITITELQ